MADGTVIEFLVCSNCGLCKAVTEFSCSKTTSRGYCYKCKACAKAYFAEYKPRNNGRLKQWRRDNPEEAKKRDRIAREKNREKINAATRAWREQNPDKVKAYQDEYEAGRKETRPAKRRAQYAANPIPHRERRKRYGKEHPEMHKAAKQRRRARKRNAQGDHTAVERLALLESQKHLCANPYCCVDLRTVPMKNLDHIIALAKGGSNFITNMQWLCRPCNSRKTTLSQEEWLQREAKRHSKAG